MKKIKKISYSLISLIAFSSFTACSISTPTSTIIKSNADFSKSNLKNVELLKLSQDLSTKVGKNNNIYVSDIGNGTSTGVSITFTVNSESSNNKNQLGSGLSIKSSSNGYVAKVVSDVKSYRFWLLHSATPPSGDVTGSIVPGTAFDFDKSSGSVTITYSNVDKNLTGEKYYIASAAYDNTIAATSPSRANIVNLNSGTTISGANVYVSTDGGEGYTGTPGTGNGAVFVASNFSVSSTNNLLIGVKLSDALGAAIESSVTVSNGSSTLPTTMAQ